jgi:hypothetical protein
MPRTCSCSPSTGRTAVASSARPESVPGRAIAEAVKPGGARSETPAEAQERLGPLAEAMTLDQQFSSARAREQLGWEPRHTDALSELAA